MVLSVKLVVSSQRIIVWFLIGLIVSVVIVWAQTITQDQESREYEQIKEVWSLWQMLLMKIVVQYVKNFLEPKEQKLHRKMHTNQPQLLILHDNACLHIANVVTKKSLLLWVGSATSCTLQSRLESTRLWLIPKIKRTYAWTMFFFCGRAFYQQYQIYSTHE